MAQLEVDHRYSETPPKEVNGAGDMIRDEKGGRRGKNGKRTRFSAEKDSASASNGHSCTSMPHNTPKEAITNQHEKETITTNECTEGSRKTKRDRSRHILGKGSAPNEWATPPHRPHRTGHEKKMIGMNRCE
jgi:hypothetical protein